MKKRVIPSVLLKGGTNVFLSQGFSPWRSVGALAQYLRIHLQREADEMIILNPFIESFERNNQTQRIFKIIRKDVNIPISYSGGISTVDDAAYCINSGFDKVFLTRLFYENPKEIKSIASVIGSQSLGGCIPYKLNSDTNCYQVWNYLTQRFFSYSVIDAIDFYISHGVGEIILYNVENDGSMKGMDKEILKIIPSNLFSIPILMAGGLGNEEDAFEILSNSSIQGVVAGSAFALTKTTPTTIREYCQSKGIKMRRV